MVGINNWIWLLCINALDILSRFTWNAKEFHSEYIHVKKKVNIYYHMTEIDIYMAEKILWCSSCLCSMLIHFQKISKDVFFTLKWNSIKSRIEGSLENSFKIVLFLEKKKKEGWNKWASKEKSGK